MKKTLTIATLMLGLSAVAGSAYAASNTDLWETTKSSEPISVEVMAKEKGITVDELTLQLKKEGESTKISNLTESVKSEDTSESNMSGTTKSSETVNLDEMAKEKGITVDELIAQLEKEGNLTKGAELTEAIQVETSNK